MRDTIDELLTHRAATETAKPAVIDPDTRITYAALDSTTRELAAAFVAAGVGKGSRVGLIMPNGVGWVRLALALTRVGAVLVPLSTLLRPRELAAQLRVAAVQFLVSVEEFRGHRYLDDLPALPALRQVWSADEVAGLTADDSARDVACSLASSVDPSDPLAIMFTSDAAFVTNVRGDRVGAVVVCDVGRTPDQLQAAARKALSSFKLPTVWVLLTSVEQVPRGSTGKVDVRRLRDMLTSNQREETQ